MPNPTTWFFVADQSRALVLKAMPSGRLDCLHDFDEPAVRAHTSELITGSRGRRADAGGEGRSAMEPHTSVQQTQVDRFVAEIAQWLHLAADAGEFDELILVAGPQMLGELRACLTTPVEQRLVDTLDKVYTKLPRPELEAQLRAHFPNRMPDSADTVPASARRGNAQPTT